MKLKFIFNDKLNVIVNVDYTFNQFMTQFEGSNFVWVSPDGVVINMREVLVIQEIKENE